MLGRPWPQPGEPLFIDDDTDLLLAWQEELEGRHTGCGHLLAETTDPANVEAYTGHSQVCYACAAIDREHRRFTSEGSAADSVDGRLYYVTRDTT